MGWDIALKDGRRDCKVAPFTFGSVLLANAKLEPQPNYDASMSLTYNYSTHYFRTIDKTEGLRWLHGKRGSDTVIQLLHAIKLLGVVRDTNYWEPAPGNAGYALTILCSWAEAHPDAVWEVT